MKKLTDNFCLALLLLGFINVVKLEEHLEVFKEEDLLQLFQDEKFVIVLLSKAESCIDKCSVLEKRLLSVREDLVEDTGGWVVRSHAPKYFQVMGFQDATILFMRDQRPLVYNERTEGDNEDNLLTYFLSNKVSIVHNLTDSDFEHKTQAGTGATTGDWLIMFTRKDCESCVELSVVLEEVSVNLKGRVNIGFVERETGPVTARRFGVKTFPSFMLFRLGKLYRYTFDKHDADILTAFAKDSFRNMKAEVVPAPKSPFDDITEAVADWLKENPEKWLLCIGCVVVLIGIIVLLNRPPPESWTKGKSKKKKA